MDVNFDNGNHSYDVRNPFITEKDNKLYIYCIYEDVVTAVIKKHLDYIILYFILQIQQFELPRMMTEKLNCRPIHLERCCHGVIKFMWFDEFTTFLLY